MIHLHFMEVLPEKIWIGRGIDWKQEIRWYILSDDERGSTGPL